MHMERDHGLPNKRNKRNTASYEPAVVATAPSPMSYVYVCCVRRVLVCECCLLLFAFLVFSERKDPLETINIGKEEGA